MRRRTVLLVVVPLLVLFALVAFAAPRRGRKEKKPAPAASASASAAASGTAYSGSEDIGAPPPKSARSDGGPRPSPLNPRANEFPDGGVSQPPPNYDQLLGDIATLRSRVAALTTTLFASKLQVVVETDDEDSARISGFTITLDDGVVYHAPSTFSASDERTVYEHAVAPGHHTIGVEVERYDVRNREYTNWQSSKFSVVVPEGKKLKALIRLEDDSDMADDFPSDQDGEYDLRVRLRARVVE
jgi:hypothetical protein